MTSAIATREQQQLAQQSNPVTALFRQFDANRFNVLAPVTHMATLPMGTRLVVTEVRVNPDPVVKEVFPIAGGALMLSKTSLDRIAQGAGISWLEERRQDNGKHPHYVEMFVRGRVTDFDGTVREITGVKAIDLRADAGDGEPGKDYAEIVGKATKGNRSPEQQLMEARKFAQEIAASKAKNRAIASALGIKRAYTREELSRPFIVPKLTVDTSNQAAQQMMLANMMGAVGALYGGQSREKIVDATFEESQSLGDASPVASGNEAAGVVPPAPAASEPPSLDEEPPHDDATGEVIASPEVIKARTGAAYSTLRKAYPSLSNGDWKKLVRDSTGKDKYDQLTATDLDQIDAAVVSAAKTLGGGK